MSGVRLLTRGSYPAHASFSDLLPVPTFALVDLFGNDITTGTFQSNATTGIVVQLGESGTS